MGREYGGHANADRERFLTYRGWLMMVVDQMALALKPGGAIFLQVGLTKDDGAGSPSSWAPSKDSGPGLTPRPETKWAGRFATLAAALAYRIMCAWT